MNQIRPVKGNSMRFVVLLLLSLCIAPLAFAQNANAIHLKDGNRVVGYITALDSLGDVRIQTLKGEVLSYPMSQVDDINWSYRIKELGVGTIYRYGDKFRWHRNNMELSDRDFERFFDNELYHEYINGSNLFNIGGACWLYSFTCAVICVMEADFNSVRQDASFYLSAAGAGVLAYLGYTFTKAGKKRLDWVERTFNEQNAAANDETSGLFNTIRLNPSIMLSAEHDLAFGATLSLSF